MPSRYGGLQLVTDVSVRHKAQALFRYRRAADLPTQPFELLALIHPRRHTGVQGESGYLTDPFLERLIAGRQRL